jgi:hypothetical protein
VWLCPVCSVVITERRRRDLQRAISRARELGLRVLMVSLTYRHHRGDDLRSGLDALLRGVRRMLSGRGMLEVRQRFGLVGWMKALEVTHGENGWHPHCHFLLFVPAEVDVPALDASLRALWDRSRAFAGLTGDEHAYKLNDTDDAAAEYFAKWGHDRAWDEAAELTKSPVKRGRCGSRSPFGLLADADAGDQGAGALFVEYARAFKGRHQVQWSRGLAALLEVEDKTDEEVIAEVDAAGVLLALMRAAKYRLLVANDAVPDLLVAIGRGFDAVLDVCLAVGMTRGDVICANGDLGGSVEAV